MGKMLDLLGNVVGVTGVIVCILAGVSRFLGSYHLLGFEIDYLVYWGYCADGYVLSGETASVDLVFCSSETLTSFEMIFTYTDKIVTIQSTS